MANHRGVDMKNAAVCPRSIAEKQCCPYERRVAFGLVTLSRKTKMPPHSIHKDDTNPSFFKDVTKLVTTIGRLHD